MKINVNELKTALETVKPGLSNKEMIEQSTSFCFANGRVITFNDEISVSCPVNLDITGAIDSKVLYAYLNKLKVEEADVLIQDNEIVVKSGRSKASFTIQSEIKLPFSEVPDAGNWETVDSELLKALEFCMGACSRDMSQPVITNVHLKDTFVEGTDRYRIAQYQMKKKFPFGEILIPATICPVFIKFKPTHISIVPGWVHLTNETKAVLSFRTFAEKFPELSKFTNIEGEEITLAKDIIEIIDRAVIFAKKDTLLDESITITVEAGKMIISAVGDTSKFEEKARSEYKGSTITFIIAPYLFKDIISQNVNPIFAPGRLLFTGENWKYLTMLKS